MKNRILDCVDGRFSSARLSEQERRLLERIEDGLRSRTDDYRSAAGPYRRRRSIRLSSSSRRRTSSERSPLDAFLERSARRGLKAG